MGAEESLGDVVAVVDGGYNSSGTRGEGDLAVIGQAVEGVGRTNGRTDDLAERQHVVGSARPAWNGSEGAGLAKGRTGGGETKGRVHNCLMER